mmetsp:Transcript_14244/g.40882  ORF Transcript_14244/g.40882 Transcript_14244/m.40882 type:complete len:578 (-) Transcript_14244:60-1793(-)
MVSLNPFSRAAATDPTEGAAPTPTAAAAAAAEEDPFAGMPTFDPDFDSALGAVTSTTVQSAPAPAPAPAPAQASTMSASRSIHSNASRSTTSSKILNQVRGNSSHRPNQRRSSTTPFNTEVPPVSQNQAQPHQQQQQQQHHNNVDADYLRTFRSSRPSPRAEVLHRERQEDTTATPTDSTSRPSPFDEVQVKEHERSTARDARRERLARERMAAARSSSSSRSRRREEGSPAPDPPSSCDLGRDGNSNDVLNTSDEILNSTADAFFASAEPSAVRSAERHNPEEMASDFYTRSRSVSPRKARSQMAPPPTSSSSNPSKSARARSQSHGRSGGSSISGSIESSISSSRRSTSRSRSHSRSRASSRSRRHRSKSRDGRDGTSVVSVMSVEEESQFLDSLANHFPPDLRTREYNPSSKSLENARMIIDRQVHKIQEDLEHETSVAPVRPQQLASAPIKRLPPRPTTSPAKSGSSYGASLDAAATAHTVGGRSGGPSSVISNLSFSEEAYTHGLGRNQADRGRRSMSAHEDEEEDDFSAFGAIMSSDGSLPSRRRNETPRKATSGNGLRGSPDSVANFEQY